MCGVKYWEREIRRATGGLRGTLGLRALIEESSCARWVLDPLENSRTQLGASGIRKKTIQNYEKLPSKMCWMRNP